MAGLCQSVPLGNYAMQQTWWRRGVGAWERIEAGEWMCRQADRWRVEPWGQRGGGREKGGTGKKGKHKEQIEERLGTESPLYAAQTCCTCWQADGVLSNW